GARREAAPPRPTTRRSGAGRKAGGSWARRRSSTAAARGSSGRITRSTKASVKSSPFGSRSRSERSPAAAGTSRPAASCTQVRTWAATSSAVRAVVRRASRSEGWGTGDNAGLLLDHGSRRTLGGDGAGTIARHPDRRSSAGPRRARAARRRGDPVTGSGRFRDDSARTVRSASASERPGDCDTMREHTAPHTTRTPLEASMKKFIFLAGLGIGFVIGSRAGRGPYESLERTARQVADDPEVQRRAAQAKDTATRVAQDTAGTVKDKAPEVASAAQGAVVGAAGAAKERLSNSSDATLD